MLVTSLHIHRQCIQTLKDLSAAYHPMFGIPEPGRIRAPLIADRKNGVSWTNFVNNTFLDVGDVPGEECWMVRTPQIKITRPGDHGGPELCASILKVRLIYFLCNPTEDNWVWLCAGTVEAPFDHHCGRGLVDPEGGRLCINGAMHGRPATREINESRKRCKTGCRALCDSHGTGFKCIFTHSDGSLKPCCMVEDHLPRCEHTVPCFPFTS